MKRNLLWLFLVLTWAFRAQALEDSQYQTLDNPQTVAEAGKIEVAEMFWYGCPHCFHLEPVVEKWLETKPKDVNFIRIPAIFREEWVPYAKAFYVMEILNLGDKPHHALFTRIHKDGQNLNGEKTLQQFFALEGVDEKTFTETYNSFTVDLLVRKAAEATRNFRISGVPSIVVNGKFVTTATMAGGHEQMMAVVDELVAQERRANQLAADTR